MTLGIAVPAYRNIESLRVLLLSIRKCVLSRAAVVVVVDDSGDGRVAKALSREFADVQWSVNDKNRGFGFSANRAVRECDADIVILLNDDVELIDDITYPLENRFADDSIFAVTFQSKTRSGLFREGAKRVMWRMGLPRVLHNPRDQYPTVGDKVRSDYAVGGHCALRREMFLSIGGFDTLFEPFYWEDVDLCARAMKMGWNIVYADECTVIHDGPSAIRTSHEQSEIQMIIWRNRVLYAVRHGTKLQQIQLKISLVYNELISVACADRAKRGGIAAARAIIGQGKLTHK